MIEASACGAENKKQNDIYLYKTYPWGELERAGVELEKSWERAKEMLRPRERLR